MRVEDICISLSSLSLGVDSVNKDKPNEVFAGGPGFRDFCCEFGQEDTSDSGHWSWTRDSGTLKDCKDLVDISKFVDGD